MENSWWSSFSRSRWWVGWDCVCTFFHLYSVCNNCCAHQFHKAALMHCRHTLCSLVGSWVDLCQISIITHGRLYMHMLIKRIIVDFSYSIDICKCSSTDVDNSSQDNSCLGTCNEILTGLGSEILTDKSIVLLSLIMGGIMLHYLVC